MRWFSHVRNIKKRDEEGKTAKICEILLCIDLIAAKNYLNQLLLTDFLQTENLVKSEPFYGSHILWIIQTKNKLNLSFYNIILINNNNNNNISHLEPDREGVKKILQ